MSTSERTLGCICRAIVSAALLGLASSPSATAAEAERGPPPLVVAQSVLPNWAAGLGGTGKPETPAAASEASPAPSAAKPADAAPAAAPQAPSAALEAVLQPVKRITTLIEDFEKTVDRVKEQDDELARARVEIDKLPPATRSAIDAIVPRLAELKAQIDKLGPAPKADQPAESPEVAAERARLNAMASHLDGAIKSAELVEVRAKQLIDRVQELRQKIFASQVLRRTQHSPLKPSLWRTVLEELPRAGHEISAILRGWWTAVEARRVEIGAIALISLFIYFGLRRLRRIVVRSRREAKREGPPRFFERAALASWLAPAIALPGAAAAIFLYIGLNNRNLVFLQTERFSEIVLYAALIFFVVSGLSRAILQPGSGDWRLLSLSDATARRLNVLTRLAALVYGLDLVLQDMIKMLYLPFQVSVAQAFVFSLMFAALLFALARTPLAQRVTDHTGQQISRWHPVWLKLPLMLVALAIAAASLSGYVALGRYISSQVLLTGTAVVVIILLHLAIRAASGDSSIPGDSVGARILAGRVNLGEAQQYQLDRVIYFTFNVLLAFIAVPLLLATWGFSAPEITALVNSAIFGFDIQGVRISPTRILLAVGLFVLLLFATRLIQRWLQATLLNPSRIDAGLANSIYTAVGYAGYAIAALVAISYGGLDITNLAIVAGALSVGIGFGLQSIVNNFVSGLILLVERPIKVGDWIAVGSHEGHVRRISVRSTEIETFDRSSVIVPNSELISGTVKNRTHRNALGRIDVAVGVGYNSDPEAVRALLEKVASESPIFLKFPAPTVSFDNFAASSLDFTVRAFVSDVNKSVASATDLRIRIFKALQAAGIEIPFPQQDVHLRDLDVVKTMVARLAEERMRKAGAVREETPSGDGAASSPPPPHRNLRSVE